MKKYCKLLYAQMAILRVAASRLFHNYQRVLIVPADTATITGSRGDEAMLVVLNDCLSRNAMTHRYIITDGSERAASASERLGCSPLAAASGISFNAFRRRTVSNFDQVFIIGADVLDGHYCTEFSISLWELAEEASRQGIKATILGASFSSRPAKEVVDKLRRLRLDFEINFRDEISLKRFQSIRPDKGKLVADTAFHLKPAEGSNIGLQNCLAWASSQRAKRKRLIGININPHLFFRAEIGEIEELISSCAKSVVDLVAAHNVSVLLIPHDFREGSHDKSVLLRLLSLVPEKLHESVHLIAGEPSAAELKRLTVETDVLLTGRMHLAIAALGQGKPCAAITYQGKFEGLLSHFDLPEWLAITPQDARDPNTLTNLLINLLEHSTELEKKIQFALPRILELASANFATPDSAVRCDSSAAKTKQSCLRESQPDA